MAGIDKTYIKSYSQYREICDWCRLQGVVTDQFNNTFSPYDFIYKKYDENSDDLVEYDEEFFFDYFNHHKEFALWNTPTYFDIYLIKNCPIGFIQDRLKEQYGEEYDAIKNNNSIYDNFKRNGIRNPHFSIKYKGLNLQFKDDKLSWFIEIINEPCMFYDDGANEWYFYQECKKGIGNLSSACFLRYYGNMSPQRIRRILNKWNLPKGTILRFRANYKWKIFKHFEVTIK